jgi:hypothetical protein
VPASHEELRAAYLVTTWSVRTPGGTLRLAPGRPAPRLLRPAAIVTACNPASAPAPKPENRAAARRLLQQVSELGIAFFPARAHGSAPEWDEPGLALLGRSARDTAVRLAAAWGQNAIAAIGRDGRVVLLATRPGFCGRAVGEEV